VPPPPPPQQQYAPPPPPPPPQYIPPPPSPSEPQYLPPPPPPPGSYYPPPSEQFYDSPPTDENYLPPPPEPVVSVYVDPPTQQPEPIGVPWAPPPMLVEDPGPPPFYGAFWTGGYWVWEGQWVWAHGRWLPPPAVGYLWAPPYYENRAGVVIFVAGFWRAPGVAFIAPAPGISITVVQARPGVVMGPPVQGPQGVFVPPPPGSRPGVIVPAPVGTNPAVVVGAPPCLRPGMEVRQGDGGHVQIVAPANVTPGGRPFNTMAPAPAHLAASQIPVVRVPSPTPALRNAIPSYNPRTGFSKLPQAQPVQPVVTQPNMLRAAPSPGGPSMVPPPGGGPRPFAQPQGRPQYNAPPSPQPGASTSKAAGQPQFNAPRPPQPNAPGPQVGGGQPQPQVNAARPPQPGAPATQGAGAGHPQGVRPEAGHPVAKPAPKKEPERERVEKERRE
jgi:hypothetical protein